MIQQHIWAAQPTHQHQHELDLEIKNMKGNTHTHTHDKTLKDRFWMLCCDVRP